MRRLSFGYSYSKENTMRLDRDYPPNKSLQATRDGGFSSASRFTRFGPACLSSGRSAAFGSVRTCYGSSQC
jgi:hypothetical protein